MDKKIPAVQQKPTCEMCGTEVLAGHTLCQYHWKVRIEEQMMSNDVMLSEKKERNNNKKYFSI
jgi:hypothetical protein